MAGVTALRLRTLNCQRAALLLRATMLSDGSALLTPNQVSEALVLGLAII